MDDARRSEPLPIAIRQLPWQEGVAVPLPAEAGLTPQEHWAWARIIRGKEADMRFFPVGDAASLQSGANGPDDGAGDDPKAAEKWPAHRNLSARFMRTILFCEPWTSARARPFVRIHCARFAETLDWENESIAGEVELEKCLFSKEVKWSSLRVARDFGAEGAHFAEEAWAEKLNVGGSVFLRNASFKKDVRLIGAKVGRSVYFDGATLEGSLGADGLAVEGALFCGEGFIVKRNVHLLGAHVGGMVSFIGATLEGTLSADGLAVEGSVLCEDGFTAKGDIRLLRARVGELSFVGAALEGTLHADGLAVEGDCFLRDMKELAAADLLGARIGQDMQLSRSVIAGRVNLTGAVIKGELNLAQSKGGGPHWGKNARLVLRNATAGALAGRLDAFRRDEKGGSFVSCDLAGFSYDRIGGLGAGEAGSTLASASGNDLRAWLKCCRPKDHYDPAPYHVLARALQDSGRKDRAADVRMAQGNYELVAKGTPLQQRFMLLMSGVFIGYGERNHRALVWFAVLVIAAAAVGYWQDLKWLPMVAPEGLTDWQAWRDWIGYAFGDAVPLLTFDEGHKTFLVERFCGERIDDVCRHGVPTGLTAFFYGVKVVGFIILSYLAAGLSGLAQRRD